MSVPLLRLAREAVMAAEKLTEREEWLVRHTWRTALLTLMAACDRTGVPASVGLRMLRGDRAVEDEVLAIIVQKLEEDFHAK
jgi:hypothetical protein